MKVKKILAISSTVFFMLLLVLIGVYMDLVVYSERPASQNRQQTIFQVQRGQSFQAVADHLQRRGLITHPYKFRVLARLKGADKSIHTGEYLLSADMSPDQILERLVTGRVQLYNFTVPEGYRIQQIAAILKQLPEAGKTNDDE